MPNSTPDAAEDDFPKITVGAGLIRIEFSRHLLVRLWDVLRRRRSARRVELLPRHGEMWIKSWCEGKVSVLLVLLHPGARRCPVDRIDVEGWSIGGTALPIQPFVVSVQSTGDAEYTEKVIDLRLHESDINQVKALVAKDALASPVAQSHGLPYRHCLDVRLHFRDERHDKPPVRRIEVPVVVMLVVGPLNRSIKDL